MDQNNQDYDLHVLELKENHYRMKENLEKVLVLLTKRHSLPELFTGIDFNQKNMRIDGINGN